MLFDDFAAKLVYDGRWAKRKGKKETKLMRKCVVNVLLAMLANVLIYLSDC